MRNGASRSSKVVDFGTNRKRICDLLLVVNSNLGLTTILQQICHIAMPEPNVSTCWDVATFCPLVVFVAGVRVMEFVVSRHHSSCCPWVQWVQQELQNRNTVPGQWGQKFSIHLNGEQLAQTDRLTLYVLMESLTYMILLKLTSRREYGSPETSYMSWSCWMGFRTLKK